MSETAVRRPVSRVQVRVVGDGPVRERPDRLVTEEPMEIRVQAPGLAPEPVAVTMRTPGHDFELAVGFLLTEGVLPAPDALASAAYCLGGQGEQQYNVVTVRSRVPVVLPERRRAFVAAASCGLCGKATLDQVEVACPPLADGPVVAASMLLELPGRLRAEQSLFDATGGLHGAGLFTPDGALVAVREDVGRHNAVDKLVGHLALSGAAPADRILVVSGRLGFEIVQKAAMAGVGLVVAVSAPSSLAVDAARRLGQTVVAFVRDGHANVYTHPQRVREDD